MTDLDPSPRVDADARKQKHDRQKPLASRGTRFYAALLDGIAFVIFLLPLMVVVAILGKQPEIAWTRKALPPSALLQLGLASLVEMGFLLYQAYLITKTGQSLGKRWTKIRIVKMDGTPVSFTSGVLLRSVVPHLLLYMTYTAFGLVDILCIFRDDRRCLHDHLAGTRVVEL